MAVIRYPGSKAKLADQIVRLFPDFHDSLFSEHHSYMEPFFGAGAIGFDVIKSIKRTYPVWVNDIDPDMAALWSVVHRNPEDLMAMVDAFQPSVEDFNRFKASDGQPGTDVDRAFRKLALHRMSYSGLGYMSGGPLGGQGQSSDYKVGCRWNHSSIKKDIWACHKRMRRLTDFRITSLDFEQVMEGADERTFVYLDPPYYEQGPKLYKHSMTPDDHERLARILRDAKFPWVLSYDDHPEIRRLYDWASFTPITLTYTMSRAKESKRPKNQEVVISPAA